MNTENKNPSAVEKKINQNKSAKDRQGAFRGPGFKREKSEFDQKVLDIRRVARVVAGGKRFRFRATVVVGDHKGRVGVGVAKGADTSESIEKAARAAKKNLFTVPIKSGTIPYEVLGKFSAARVLLKPSKAGHGIVAGGAVRVVASLSGISSITSKILGTTSNKLNNARATIEALKKLKTK